MLGFTLSHQEKESGSGSSQLDEQEDISAKAVVVAHHQVHRQTQEQLYWNVVTVNNRYGERVWVPASIRPQHRLDFASQLSSITYGSMMVDGHRVHMPRAIMDYKVKKQEIETAHQVSLNCTGFLVLYLLFVQIFQDNLFNASSSSEMDRSGVPAGPNMTSTPARAAGDGAASLAHDSLLAPAASNVATGPYVVHLPHLQYGVDPSTEKYADTLADNEVGVAARMMEMNKPMLEAEHRVNIFAGRVSHLD